jgi:hypothetical protein
MEDRIRGKEEDSILSSNSEMQQCSEGSGLAINANVRRKKAASAMTSNKKRSPTRGRNANAERVRATGVTRVLAGAPSVFLRSPPPLTR